MYLRQLRLSNLCVRRLNAKLLGQPISPETVRGSRSTMLPMRLSSAHRVYNVPNIRNGVACKNFYLPPGPAARSTSVLLKRSVTASAGPADSFAVSDAPYSQQLRNVVDVNAWIEICESHSSEFNGVDNFAAIRKLVELLRFAPAGMPAQLRQRISELADGIFQATNSQVPDLDSSQQQVLVLELSQLGVVFISPEWHSCCPPVPVPLLNSLLDSLLQRLRTLRGGQVGVLLISLQRLQLCDSDAYSFILKEIERQLGNTQGENSWYRQPDHLGKLVRGVVTVFLGIPRSMSRTQAKITLTLLSDAVADLRDDNWGPDEWKNIASVVESFAEVPPSLGVPCTRMHAEIARRLTEQQPHLSGKVLSQLVAAFAAGTYADRNAIAALFRSITGRYDDQGAHTVADIADSLSKAGDVWGHEIRSMVSWVLEAPNVANESGLRMLAAGARVGLITDTQWHEYYSRFASGVMESSAHYSSTSDRECQLLLEAAIHQGVPSDVVNAVCEKVAVWMNKGAMRLWRIVPYMVIISRAPMHEREAQSNSNAADIVFDAAMTAVTKEVHPQMIMSQRGQLLTTALSASISAGRKDAVKVILGIEGISSYLQDQGEPVAQVLADAICNAKIGSGATAPVGAVWEAIMQRPMCDFACGVPLWLCGDAAALSFMSGSVYEPCLCCRPLSQMTPVNLSRLAKALWSCQPHEVYLSVLLEAALDKFSNPVENATVAHELQDVVWVVNQVKNLTHSKALDSRAYEFLDAVSEFEASPRANAAGSHSINSFINSNAAGNMKYDRVELAGMKMSALKTMLIEQNLPAGGNKSDIIERLLNPTAAGVSNTWEEVDQADQMQGMTVTQLKKLLAGKGLKVSGRKQELIDRLLMEQDAAHAAPEAPTAHVVPVEASMNDVAELPSESHFSDSEVCDTLQDSRVSVASLDDLTVADLKSLLRDNGLKVGGKKAELIQRCMANGIKA